MYVMNGNRRDMDFCVELFTGGGFIVDFSTFSRLAFLVVEFRFTIVECIVNNDVFCSSKGLFGG